MCSIELSNDKIKNRGTIFPIVRGFLFQENSLIFTETKSNEIPFYAVFSNHEEFYNVDKAWRNKWSQREGKHYALDMSHTLLSREQKNALTLPSFLSLDFIMNNDNFNSDNIILIYTKFIYFFLEHLLFL